MRAFFLKCCENPLNQLNENELSLHFENAVFTFTAAVAI